MYSYLNIGYAKIGQSDGPQLFPPIDRAVKAESIQYNRVGSKEHNFEDMNRNNICP